MVRCLRDTVGATRLQRAYYRLSYVALATMRETESAEQLIRTTELALLETQSVGMCNVTEQLETKLRAFRQKEILWT